MTPKPRLYLIDGHALAYRTYHALTAGGNGSRWTTTRGEPTAGVYGFTAVLLRLFNEDSPEYMAVAFDTGRTFRDDLFAEYKATRAKMPEDLGLQIDRIRQVVAAFGIPILEVEGYEADDVIGTVARQAAEQGVHVVVLTGDRDLLQLAETNISIRLPGRRLSDAEDFGPEEVQAKLGVRPEQIPDYKALVGDPSDNIPGVKGIGEKTAVRLLQAYGDLDGIYAHLEEVQPRYRKLLEEQRAIAFLSRDLARIRTDAPVTFDLEACRQRGYDRDRVVSLFRELEFRSLLERLPSDRNGDARQMTLFSAVEAAPRPAVVTGAEVVRDAIGLEALVRRLAVADAIAFDVETTSTDAMRAELVGLSLAVEPERGFYLPLGHAGASGGDQLAIERVLEALRGPLTDPAIPKVGHNLKYDYILLARHGLAVAPLAFDTMIAEWLCNPDSRNLGLKSLAWIRLGVEMTPIEDLIGRGRNQMSMADVAVDQVAPYAVADAAICLRLKPRLEEELAQKQQTRLFHDLEMPLVPILAEMEMTGVRLDPEVLDRFAAELEGKLAAIEQEVYQAVGHPFNINSTQQLSKVLFEELGLKPPERTRRTASGHYSTAASVLEELREAHPAVAKVLEHREIAKIKSTYADALRQQINPVTGRVHTSFSQTGSVTGRLASSDPNLQNIPIRSELGRQIRRAFVTDPGWQLISVDYSQIELRILAHMSGDEAMIQAFLDDQDIHTASAVAVFGVRPEEVTPELRRRAKAINFGLIYGMSPFGLTRTTDLTLAEAENFVAAYFERFPGVRRFLDQLRSQVIERGYVETILGRRRYFPELARGAPPVSQADRARALREAVNAPIQGSAADIIKLAMVRLPQALAEAGLQARLLLQVHDELLLEAPEPEVAETVPLVREVMGSAYQLRVPLKTDAKVGPNWYEMDPVR